MTKRPGFSRRVGALAVGSCLLGAACAVGASGAARAGSGAATVTTVEGPPRQFLLIEVVRQAQTAADVPAVAVSACRWHVNGDGALYGDHWGWCEDFQILPRQSPGYLVATTLFSGTMSGGYSKLSVLPVLPTGITVFDRQIQLMETDGRVLLGPGGMPMEMRPRVPVALGTERGLVEPPPDTGHFEPGFGTPVVADIAYSAISYGRLGSRRIAGRAT